MKGIDPTVKRETLYIAAWTLLLTLLTEAVYLLLRRWDLTVLFGNLLGAAAAILNFFLMGLTVQKAVGREEKDAANLMRLSQAGRLLLLVLVGLAAALIPVFDLIATLIPLFFPRLAVAARPLFDRMHEHMQKK
ncbi:MAG: ATP synthase subunit I [Clostridia bacterium]|nr:ATP synthase subunit I [Clostridia bacterium]